MPSNGDISGVFGVFKTICCDAEIVIGVMLMSLLAALLISWLSRRSISAPIVHLADVASAVSRDKDYSDDYGERPPYPIIPDSFTKHASDRVRPVSNRGGRR